MAWKITASSKHSNHNAGKAKLLSWNKHSTDVDMLADVQKQKATNSLEILATSAAQPTSLLYFMPGARERRIAMFEFLIQNSRTLQHALKDWRCFLKLATFVQKVGSCDVHKTNVVCNYILTSLWFLDQPGLRTLRHETIHN